jgi:hypothetical protein
VKTFLAYVWRLVVIFTGLLLAALTAGVVFTFAMANLLDPGAPNPDLVARVLEWAGFVFLVATFAGVIALVPSVILAILAEAFGWRGLVFHGVAGALLGAMVTLVWGEPQSADNVLVLAAGISAGIAGGWVYWLIAGRKAGWLFDRITEERKTAL